MQYQQRLLMYLKKLYNRTWRIFKNHYQTRIATKNIAVPVLKKNFIFFFYLCLSGSFKQRNNENRFFPCRNWLTWFGFAVLLDNLLSQIGAKGYIKNSCLKYICTTFVPPLEHGAVTAFQRRRKGAWQNLTPCRASFMPHPVTTAFL